MIKPLRTKMKKIKKIKSMKIISVDIEAGLDLTLGNGNTIRKIKRSTITEKRKTRNRKRRRRRKRKRRNINIHVKFNLLWKNKGVILGQKIVKKNAGTNKFHTKIRLR